MIRSPCVCVLASPSNDNENRCYPKYTNVGNTRLNYSVKSDKIADIIAKDKLLLTSFERTIVRYNMYDNDFWESFIRILMSSR